jgi:TolB-like protein
MTNCPIGNTRRRQPPAHNLVFLYKEFGMKKTVLSLGVLLMVINNISYAQQITVAVSPFEVRGGFTKDDADTVYELFVGELAAAASVRVVDRNSFDKIMAELQFQQSDWTSGNRVAEFGKALGANSIIRGQLMSLGGKPVITANVLDINTAQILSSGSLQLNNIGELFGRMPGFVRDTVKALPKSGTEVGGRGPGGGLIFFAEGGAYMEVSGLLGTASWDEALTLARNYRGGGYSDWHLPTRPELELIYQNLRAGNIGNLGNDWHWSSSEYNNSDAWYRRFGDGIYGNARKNSTYSVRAVRAF